MPGSCRSWYQADWQPGSGGTLTPMTWAHVWRIGEHPS
jgi:hypothetical protein